LIDGGIDEESTSLHLRSGSATQLGWLIASKKRCMRWAKQKSQRGGLIVFDDGLYDEISINGDRR
jgi:hypothetical protein